MSSPPQSEPFGTTPLPTFSAGSPVHVTIDASTLFANAPQQPQTQQLAAFDANPPGSDSGNLVAVNPHFTVYAVKNGLIRVLHRHSALRSLLRHHKNQTVTDISFFHDGDILATAGYDQNSSSIFIWRIFEKASEICSDVLFEIQGKPLMVMTRIIWHPFNPNQFWMIHTNGQQPAQQQRIATLVESTRLDTTPHEELGHPVCRIPEDGVIVNGAIQLMAQSRSPLANLTDLCWSSQQTKHVLAVFDNGDIVLWDLKQLTNSTHQTRAVTPKCLGVVQDDGPVSQCLFLPHDNALSAAATPGAEQPWTPCFVTGKYQNKVITLWSVFGPNTNALPTKLQVISLEHPSSSYLLGACFGPAPVTASPPSCFLVMADRTKGEILALHCKSEWNAQQGKAKRALLVGCDYVIPFQTLYPTYSWSVVAVPTTDISEEELSEQGSLVFDMKLFAYQSAAVQALTLTSYMCLPPEHSWTDPTPGVRVQRLLADAASAHVSDIGSSDGDELQFDETYDVDDDDLENNGSMDGDDEDFQAPDPSLLPPPPAGFSDIKPTPALVANPFANWLGAVASNVIPTPTPAAQPAPSRQQPVPAANASAASSIPLPTPPPPAFLSPMDILSGATQPTSASQSSQSASHKTREMTPTTSNVVKGQKKVPKSEPNQPQILKREENAPAPASASPAVPPAPLNVSEKAPPAMKDAALLEVMRQAIREEVRATMVPQLQEMLEKTLKIAVVNDLRAAIGRVKLDTGAVASAVSQNVETSMQTAFTDSMRTVMIPALESITNQVLTNVSGHLEKTESVGLAADRDMDAITKQLGTMTQLVVKLTEEVHLLRETVTKQQNVLPPTPPPSKAPVAGSAEKIKNEVLASLKTKNYNEAFTKAVSASTAEVALFCCAHSDVNEVLGGATPKLSPMILLCLMQQLGTLIGAQNPSTNIQLELEWLQEISLCLNTTDPLIVKHVPGVLQQLVAGINSRMAQNDPALRRPLQRLLQVIRGMQLT